MDELAMAFLELTLEPLASLFGDGMLLRLNRVSTRTNAVAAWGLFAALAIALWHWRGSLSAHVPALMWFLIPVMGVSFLALVSATGAVAHERLAARRRQMTLGGPR